MVSAASAAPAFPERVGKYELLLPLGTGGTATVYLARTRGVAGFEREVALKLVHAHLRADEESRLHLLEEARLAARIRHPNVVSVTEVDADSCGVFLVMDYVEGETLSGLVRVQRDQNQRLPLRLVARIVNDALAGLHAAHELRDKHGELLGLVHRDFSPQNILVGVEGVSRLADFGVAKAASRTVRTKTGLVKGKVAYMSPEQARGHKVDRRCDVWAAGVVVWELITGRKLYDHEDDVATLLSVVTEEPPRLSSVLQGVPRALDEAVAYALTGDVSSRCPSAEAFRCLLEAAWTECGGMASATELGTFVRHAVGDRLAERRALAAHGLSSSPPPPAAPGPSRLPSPASLTPGPTSVPEEGTKTAISAAVPSAEMDPPFRGTRAWKRSAGTAAVLALAAGVATLMGVLVKGQDPGTDPPESAKIEAAVAPSDLAAGGEPDTRAPGASPAHDGDGSTDANRAKNDVEATAAPDEPPASDQGQSPSAEAAASASEPPTATSQRRATPRRSRAKRSRRASGTRARARRRTSAKKTTTAPKPSKSSSSDAPTPAKRVLPLPKPPSSSEPSDSQRSRVPRLARDPYDSNR